MKEEIGSNLTKEGAYYYCIKIETIGLGFNVYLWNYVLHHLRCLWSSASSPDEQWYWNQTQLQSSESDRAFSSFPLLSVSAATLSCLHKHAKRLNELKCWNSECLKTKSSDFLNKHHISITFITKAHRSMNILYPRFAKLGALLH